MTSDRDRSSCAAVDLEGAGIVSRLVGVPDGQPRKLWKLWAGAGGDNRAARFDLLSACRADDRGEAAIAHLVTYGVLRVLGDLAATAPYDVVVDVFASAGPEQLTAWADDPSLLAARLSGADGA